MKKTFFYGTLLSCYFLTGCATIVSDSEYSVNIQSEPSGAEFSISEVRTGNIIHKGVTPSMVTLPSGAGYFKNAQYNITFNKKGVLPQTIPLKAKIDGWYFGNIVFGGLLGLIIIDPITGAMYKLPPEVKANLTPSQSKQLRQTKKAQNTIKFVPVEQLPLEQRAQLVRIN